MKALLKASVVNRFRSRIDVPLIFSSGKSAAEIILIFCGFS
jgi:hypothetical protein